MRCCLLCLSLLLGLLVGSVARAEDPLVGKRVVVIRDNAPLEVNGKEVAKAADCSVFTVKSVQGNFLWIESEKAYLRRADVVPFEDAIAHYTRQLETNKTARNYWSRAKIWRLKGELDIALGDINDAIRLNSKESDWFLNRGILWYGKKEYDKAIADYGEAIRLNPKSGVAYQNRGLAWANKQEYDRAITDYSDALKLINPDKKTLLLSESDISGGDSVAMANSRATTLDNRGLAWVEKGEYEKALADYEEAIRLDPKYYSPRENRHVVWAAQGAWDEIIADCDKWLQERPGQIHVLNCRAFAHDETKNLDKALVDYTEVIRLDPKNVLAFNNRGWVWDQKGEFDKALADYEEAIRLDPTYENPRESRRELWKKQGAWGKVIADYEATIKEGAPTSGNCNMLAWLLATCPDEKCRNGQRAVEYATKACELTAWNEAHHLDTLAAAYAEAGDFDKAVEWQQKGMDLAPQDQKAELESRLKLYQDKKPYRQPAPQ